MLALSSSCESPLNEEVPFDGRIPDEFIGTYESDRDSYWNYNKSDAFYIEIKYNSITAILRNGSELRINSHFTFMGYDKKTGLYTVKFLDDRNIERAVTIEKVKEWTMIHQKQRLEYEYIRVRTNWSSYGKSSFMVIYKSKRVWLR